MDYFLSIDHVTQNMYETYHYRLCILIDIEDKTSIKINQYINYQGKQTLNELLYCIGYYYVHLWPHDTTKNMVFVWP